MKPELIIVPARTKAGPNTQGSNPEEINFIQNHA